MRLIWSPQARDDLQQMLLFLADKNPYAAKALLLRIEEAAEQLIENPYLGRPGRVPGTREWVVTHSRYLLPYQLFPDRIEILRVYHGARQWPEHFE